MEPNSNQQPQVFEPQSTYSSEPRQDGGVSGLNNTQGKPQGAPSSGGEMKKKILVVLGGVVGLLVIIIVILMIFSGGNEPAQETTQQSQETEGPQAAQSIGVEQANISINQDLSGLDDASDFKNTDFDDESLGL